MINYQQEANISDSVERSITRIIAQGRTPYQEYLFFESEMHGVCISLDGDIQSCESDETLYHEALVHPAMLMHHNPKSVLIMGGGEGATAREVLRHSSVEKVVMVDIDESFVSLCREIIPTWGAAAFDDPRLELLYEDINTYLGRCTEKFDVVIGDLIDVNDWESPAAFLYGEKLYATVKSRMNQDGIIATQGGALNVHRSTNHTHIRSVMSKVFSEINSYGVVIPSFYHLWGYVIASDSLLLPGERDMNLVRRYAEAGIPLEALGIEGLKNMFSLPSIIQRNLTD